MLRGVISEVFPCGGVAMAFPMGISGTASYMATGTAPGTAVYGYGCGRWADCKPPDCKSADYKHSDCQLGDCKRCYNKHTL